MKLPQFVVIEFEDHCQGSADSEPIPCEVVGVLYKEDKKAYYVACWIADGCLDHNTEQFVILKSAVSRVVRLKPQGSLRKATRQNALRKLRSRRTETAGLSASDKLKMLG